MEYNKDEQEMHYTRVRARVERRAATPELLAKAGAVAVDPDALTEGEPFFFHPTISNNRLDWYHTRMTEGTLQNFAADAVAGVAFLDSHNSRRLGLGRSVDATVRAQPAANPDFAGEPLIEVAADFFTIPGYNPGGGSITSDDLIRGVRTGLIFDVSVGFYGDLRCALCGQRYYSRECPHILGVEYDVTNHAGTVTGQQVAWAWVEDGHLAEVSAVYDGATPGAMIQKMQRAIQAGGIDPAAIPMLEARHRVQLPRPAAQTAVAEWKRSAASAATEGAEDMDEEIAHEDVAEAARAAPPEPGNRLLEKEQLGAIRRAVAEVLPDADGDDQGAVSAVRALIVDHARLAAEADSLRAYAAIGQRYRTDLIEAVLVEGVRAIGERFNAEAVRSTLEAASLEVITSYLEMYGGEARARFVGGRRTVDADEADPTPDTPNARDTAHVPAWLVHR